MTHTLAVEADFTQQVNAALKSYHSVLALARSPLANSLLVAPLLVLDDVSPTADERGHALRLVLQWAVNRLAPGAVQFPLGCYRPYDDPTWRDPHWWRYNILRHRYLEPIHPDEFVEGGRSTETLMALTGIPSTDTFFDERNRAIREVAQRLGRQRERGDANADLQRLALAEVYQPLQTQDEPRALLSIAATFHDVFPRLLLLEMAGREHLRNVATALAYLTTHRFLLMGDEAANLWLSPVLRTYVYTLQTPTRLKPRHSLAAKYYQQNHEVLKAALHLQQAEQWTEAATLLLAAAEELKNDLQNDELRDALLRFNARQLTAPQWFAIQLLLSDLCHTSGRQEEAMAACRRALKATNLPAQHALIYRRMGKLYENHNQLHALGYYQQAADRIDPTDPELLELLRDRAWLHIYRQEWDKAQADLSRALAQAPALAKKERADIYDALASLYHAQKQYATAIDYARSALAMREELGDARRVAASHNNLGLIYSDMGEYDQAIAAYQEAMTTYRRLSNRSLIAGALLNIGMVHHLSDRLAAAVQAYQESLAICQEIGLPLVEVRAHANLAEALAPLGETASARQHWQAGYALSLQAGFDDEAADLRKLQQTMPALQLIEPGAEVDARPATTLVSPVLEPEAQVLLELVKRVGQVTPKLLMATLPVSKATATRRLSELAERGVLAQHGKGRGTYYTFNQGNSSTVSQQTKTPLPPAPATQIGQREEILRKLRQQELTLRAHYGLAALGLVDMVPTPDPTPVPLVDVMVRFVTLPPLRQFFELEKQLATLLGVRVDLRLEESEHAAATTSVPTHLVWVWR